MYQNEVKTAPKIRFARLTEHAMAPTRGSANAAGYDLYRCVILFFNSVVILRKIAKIGPIKLKLRENKVINLIR